MTKDANGIDCTLPNTLPAPTFFDPSPNKYALGSGLRVDLSCTFRLVTPFLSNVIGDSAGNISVGTSAAFTIHSGSVNSVAVGGNAPAPSQSPTPAPTQISSRRPRPRLRRPQRRHPSGHSDCHDHDRPDSDALPRPRRRSSPTPVPPSISFYGSTTSTDAPVRGGPPGSTYEEPDRGHPERLCRVQQHDDGPTDHLHVDVR